MDAVITKICKNCGEEKLLSAFYRKADNLDGKHNICSICYKLRYWPQRLKLRKFYIYEHVRSDTGAVFYVGKGCHERAESMEKRNEWHARIVAKLEREGHAVAVKTVFDKLLEDEAFALEQKRIKFWRAAGVELCNLTDGGEGFSGLFRTDAHRENISKGLMGRKLSPEHVEAMRAGLVGRKQTPEEIEKRRIANMLRPRTEEQKQTMRDAHTVEQIARRSSTVIANNEAVERTKSGFYKRCISCSRVYDTSCFSKRTASEDGLHIYCRGCKNAKSRAQKAKYNKFGINYSDPEAVVVRRGVENFVPTGVLKKCATCKEVMDAIHFSKRTASADGLHFHCRACMALKHAAQK